MSELSRSGGLVCSHCMCGAWKGVVGLGMAWHGMASTGALHLDLCVAAQKVLGRCHVPARAKPGNGSQAEATLQLLWKLHCSFSCKAGEWGHASGNVSAPSLAGWIQAELPALC